jgi:hypothetical protein
MDEIIVPDTKKDTKTYSAEWTKTGSTTQVVGEIVIIAGCLYLVHRGYRALIKRGVRKELKKNEK